MQRTIRFILAGMIVTALIAGCNDGLSSTGNNGSQTNVKRGQSQRVVIDNAEYVDFTVPQYNAKTYRREDMLYLLNGGVYKNGNSHIRINAMEGTIEISSDSGLYNGKKNCQIFGVFGFDVLAASEDCLYIRKSQTKNGYIIIDNNTFRNDSIPDLAVCLPLYGFSRNRIEVSSVMDGYIVMPSGTYWKK